MYGFKRKQHTYAFTANQVIVHNVMRTATMRWMPLFSDDYYKRSLLVGALI